MGAPLLLDRDRREEQVHQHGLAAAHVAVEIDALDPDPRTLVSLAEQPPQRGGPARQLRARQPRLERGKVGKRIFLARIALDLSGCGERAIAFGNTVRHAALATV